MNYHPSLIKLPVSQSQIVRLFKGVNNTQTLLILDFQQKVMPRRVIKIRRSVAKIDWVIYIACYFLMDTTYSVVHVDDVRHAEENCFRNT